MLSRHNDRMQHFVIPKQWHRSCISVLWAAPSCSSPEGNSVQRRGLVSQGVQNLNPSVGCSLSVVFLFSAAKSYPELKNQTKQKHIKKAFCLAWLLCITVLSSLTPQPVLTLSVHFILPVVNSLWRINILFLTFIALFHNNRLHLENIKFQNILQPTPFFYSLNQQFSTLGIKPLSVSQDI